MTPKKRSNEEVVAALIQCGTIKKAADVLDLKPQTIYDRLKLPEVREMYDTARKNLLEEAVASLQSKAGEAVETIYTLMKSEDVAPQTRLQCAESVLRHVEKLTQVTDLARRVEALEMLQSAADLSNWGM